MLKRLDFYTVAAPLALIVGFCWVYLTMVLLKIPGWPAMVAMAAYYAVGGLACHQRHANGSRSIKGLLLGVAASWLGVWVWTSGFKNDPVAMAVVMGVVVVILVLATKVRFLGAHHFIAMPQAFLGATIYFGLFNTFMIAKGAPQGLLHGSLGTLHLEGPAQPHVAGVLAVISSAAGVLLGLGHQTVSLRLASASPSQDVP